jgi:endo-1,4-beta-xylanase
LGYQAAMYKFVVDSYIRYVPEAQRQGIAIWGMSDQDSWMVMNQKKNDCSLLFDNSYGKKPANSAVLQALRGK